MYMKTLKLHTFSCYTVNRTYIAIVMIYERGKNTYRRRRTRSSLRVNNPVVDVGKNAINRTRFFVVFFLLLFLCVQTLSDVKLNIAIVDRLDTPIKTRRG